MPRPRPPKPSNPSSLLVLVRLLAILFPLLLFACPIQADSHRNTETRGPIIGIDLGNSHTRVAWHDGTQSRILTDADGHRSFLSWVALPDFNSSNPLVGEAARDWAHKRPNEAVGALKYHITRGSGEYTTFESYTLIDMVVNDGCAAFVQEMYKDRYIASNVTGFEGITSLLLGRAKQVAEESLGEEVWTAVVTTPPWFDDAQQNSVKKAGELVGLDVIRVMKEPLAAAFAYEYDKRAFEERNLLIYEVDELGSTTTIMVVEEGVFEILGSDYSPSSPESTWTAYVTTMVSNEYLAAQDGQKTLVRNHVKRVAGYPNDVGLQNLESKELIARQVDRAEVTLRQNATAEIVVEDFSMTLTREHFERFVLQDFEENLALHLQSVLKEVNLTLSAVDDVIFIGDTSLIPKARAIVQSYTGKQLLHNENVTTDEAIVLGAAAQGYVFTEEYDNWVGCSSFLPVSPRNLGVRTGYDTIASVIHRGTALPVRKWLNFTTMYDGQTTAILDVYEERLDEGSGFEDAHRERLCILTLDIPPAPRGEPRFEVSFEHEDTHRIRYYHPSRSLLTVVAKDIGTGVEASCRVNITESGELVHYSGEDVAMVKRGQIVIADVKSLGAPMEMIEL